MKTNLQTLAGQDSFLCSTTVQLDARFNSLGLGCEACFLSVVFCQVFV